MPGMGIHLLFMGLILKGNMQIKGDEHTLEIIKAQTGKVKIVALTRLFTDMIYWVNFEVLTGSELLWLLIVMGVVSLSSIIGF